MNIIVIIGRGTFQTIKFKIMRELDWRRIIICKPQQSWDIIIHITKKPLETGELALIEEIEVTKLLTIGFGTGFCLLIAFVIIVRIVCKTFKETTGSLENILKGPTLPIITVIVIVGTITLLALLGILKENSITAILGGIVGYVLGGVKKDH